MPNDLKQFQAPIDSTPYSLGRHVHHDSRSAAFSAPTTVVLRSIEHIHFGPILDQGAVGSCTGHALVDCLMTMPDYNAKLNLTHDDALAIYERATQIDPWPGSYPPDDTGSDALSACKAAQEKGWIVGYDHAFGLGECLKALVLHPVMIGSTWYDGMFNPDPTTGMLTISGPPVGGHEYALTAINTRTRTVKMLNSWSARWGKKGFAFMSWDTLGTLLADNGDCTVPRLAA